MTLSETEIKRQVLESTKALYYALEDAADMLHELTSKCGACEGDGRRPGGEVCEACAPIRQAERRALESQRLVPQIEQLSDRAEQAYKRRAAELFHEADRLRVERDLALNAYLALRNGSRTFGAAIKDIGPLYITQPSQTDRIGSREAERINNTETFPLRVVSVRENAGLISARLRLDRLMAGAESTVGDTPGNHRHSGSTHVEEARVASEPLPLVEALLRLKLEMIHFEDSGRGIQFLINGLQDALEQARGVAASRASAEISRTEMIERLRDCRDSLMRPDGESIYSPAETAVAIDAAIGRLPLDVARLPRAVDLIRELELAVNEFEAFGLASEAQAHRRWVQLIRDALYEPGTTSLSVQLSGPHGIENGLPDGESEGEGLSEASPRGMS